MGRLQGKIALITGAASGIGSACAVRFAEEGALIIGFDLSPNADDSWKAAIQVSPESYLEAGDVRDEERISDVLDAGVATFGHIDVVVNSAGIAAGGPIHLVPTEDWDRVMDVNLKGTFLICKHVIPKMLEQGKGSIINIASIEGIEGFEGGSVYNASKAGVILLTKNMAMDYARRGIRVNSICPGFISTPLAAQTVLENEILKDFRGPLVDSILLGRPGYPQEVANAALFLASEEASHITGHTLVVDGGFTVGHRLGITKIMGLE
jgi:NAD(P)-dependent dehydrogenase (short-subunit alcohol dehydrogenase family)